MSLYDEEHDGAISCTLEEKKRRRGNALSFKIAQFANGHIA